MEMGYDNEYIEQAEEFLKEANATCEIEFIGYDINDSWGEDAERAKYRVTLKTPTGEYRFPFWNSINNTRLLQMGSYEYMQKYKYTDLYQAGFKLHEAKMKAKPTSYDVLAALMIWDGSFEEFCDDFGYSSLSIKEGFNVLQIYHAVLDETKNLRRIFTPEQLDKLSEIN